MSTNLLKQWKNFKLVYGVYSTAERKALGKSAIKRVMYDNMTLGQRKYRHALLRSGVWPTGGIWHARCSGWRTAYIYAKADKEGQDRVEFLRTASRELDQEASRWVAGRVPMPGDVAYSHHTIYALESYGLHYRGLSDGSLEWMQLTFTLLDPVTGRAGEIVGRKALRASQAKKHYIDYDKQSIVPVAEDVWSKWPEQNVLICARYKNFNRTVVKQSPFDSSSPHSPHIKSPFSDKLFSNPQYAIGQYHQTKNNGYIKLDAVPGLTFGAEIEISIRSNQRPQVRDLAAAEILYEMKSVLDVERDGSVPNGFEIITGYGSFDALDGVVRKLYEKFLSAHSDVFVSSPRTGLHFHVGGEDQFETEQIGIMRTIETLYPALMNIIVGRGPTQYCGRATHPTRLYSTMPTDFQQMYLAMARGARESRRSSFNITSWDGESEGPTFEWRACKSSTAYASWRARLEFINVLTKWVCEEGAGKDGVPQLDALLTRIMDAPRTQTVALRRTLKSAPAGRVLTLADAKIPIAYDGRREYAAIRV